MSMGWGDCQATALTRPNGVCWRGLSLNLWGAVVPSLCPGGAARACHVPAAVLYSHNSSRAAVSWGRLLD